MKWIVYEKFCFRKPIYRFYFLTQYFMLHMNIFIIVLTIQILSIIKLLYYKVFKHLYPPHTKLKEKS